MDGYDASTYGERFADVYDDWYDDVTDVAGCVDRVVSLVAEVGGGPVLELGVGSGRLALPLAGRGLEVHGVDASPAMLQRLAAKPGAEQVRATLGDMTDLDLPEAPRFAVALVAFNTLFNLGSAEQQRRCFASVARHLAPGGIFVVEAFVPTEADSGAAGAVTPRQITADEVVLTVSHHDPDEQTVTGQHVHITEAGIRLRPWHLRYAPPAELDALAADAGLHLRWRAAGWRDEPFDDTSGVHVSAYASGNVRTVRPDAATLPR